ATPSKWMSRKLPTLGVTVTAEAADKVLTERGFVLRRVVPYGFDNALRMTIGTEEACRGVVAILEELLGSKGGA
ncbi:MAG: histidinol-phosphate transaminase, partial [Pseudomonadota bacterium]